MSFQRTRKEIEKHHIDKMGPILGKLFDELWKESNWLYIQWNEFVHLFGTLETLNVLNTTTPGFTSVIHETMWEALILHICRLTDRVKVSGKDTLTLQRLPSLVDPTIRPLVKQRLDTALDKRKFAKDWRDRHVGHRELQLALDEKNAMPLASATRNDVDEALKSIVSVLHSVEAHYCGTTTAYEFADLPGNAKNLIYYLRKGQKAEPTLP